MNKYILIVFIIVLPRRNEMHSMLECFRGKKQYSWITITMGHLIEFTMCFEE